MQKQEKTCNSNSNSNSDNTKNDSTLTLSGSLYTYSYFLPELSVRCCDCDGPDAVWPVRRKNKIINNAKYIYLLRYHDKL